MPLVFQAMQRIKTIPCSLTIVGGGSSLPEWKEMVMKAGMTSCVTFTGPVKRDALQKYYANADAFVFPALRDSGGSGLLEAMSLGLPSVCCNWGGPAEMVDDESGIRVSVETPDAAIQGFAAAFERLYKETEWRARLGANAFKRAQELFSWDQKRRLLEATYARCLGESL
jgi:glycosyltransferase involved in cell wall biosynthesis